MSNFFYSQDTQFRVCHFAYLCIFVFFRMSNCDLAKNALMQVSVFVFSQICNFVPNMTAKGFFLFMNKWPKAEALYNKSS